MQNTIAKRRQALGMSQEALAGAAKISRPYLSTIENGHATPTGDVMFKIAQALKAKVQDIFFADSVQYDGQVEATGTDGQN